MESQLDFYSLKSSAISIYQVFFDQLIRIGMGLCV